MTTLIVKCPKCDKPVSWTAEELFRPFCSERCKFADFGEWIFEEKRIPGEPLKEDGDDFNEDLYQ